ncbi:hypothetical protein Salat_0578800 [Sesamum alatum]|uniref:Copia-type polyprotein n=1 Tax=Sesamum alatum TaxID=300844 RepID=A0AAE1YQJ8_9LAMI|nr:hypothetical protein Salat_0578800 [Sesamum alatum]
MGDQENEVVGTNETEEGGDDIENPSSHSSTDDDAPSTDEGRHRAPPIWMRDYETGEGLSEEDNEAFLVISTANDPIQAEEAVKSEKWRRAMDAEMEEIQKNNM